MVMAGTRLCSGNLVVPMLSMESGSDTALSVVLEDARIGSIGAQGILESITPGRSVTLGSVCEDMWDRIARRRRKIRYVNQGRVYRRQC